jgi:AraC family transcriptional regulator, arabinose operon regulatory protein
MDPRIARAVAFIETHIQETMTVPQIAAHVSLSVSQLTRLFRRDTGTTPTAYLRQMRMQLARALIERTSLPVTDVMRQVGISDPSHFARDFRRAHGLSPRPFRQQHRAGEYDGESVGAK